MNVRRFRALFERGASYAEIAAACGVDWRTAKKYLQQPAAAVPLAATSRKGTQLRVIDAEEGIDVNNIDVPDIETLQRAMNRAVERHNTARFTPVGDTRELAAAALRLVVEALAQDDTTVATAILDQVQPESPDNSAPTVSACIGITLGLLDDWLGGHDPTTPIRLADRVRLPIGHWKGERAARDILALAAAIRTWSNDTSTPVPQLARTAIR